jgi:hypothetical protein
MAGHLGLRQRLLLIAWLLPFIVFFKVAFWDPVPPLSPKAVKRIALKVYSNPQYYRELEKPADFGLEQLAAVVNYLLLATAAILAFLTKSLIDSQAEPSKSETSRAKFTRTELLLFLHAGIACFFSLFCGVCAYLTLPDISVVETFAVTGFLSRCVEFQIAGLLLAVLLLLVAFGGVVRNQLP